MGTGGGVIFCVAGKPVAEVWVGMDGHRESFGLAVAEELERFACGAPLNEADVAVIVQRLKEKFPNYSADHDYTGMRK
jgi:hypothetical protein